MRTTEAVFAWDRRSVFAAITPTRLHACRYNALPVQLTHVKPLLSNLRRLIFDDGKGGNRHARHSGSY